MLAQMYKIDPLFLQSYTSMFQTELAAFSVMHFWTLFWR
jgi:hypothetical protein